MLMRFYLFWGLCACLACNAPQTEAPTSTKKLFESVLADQVTFKHSDWQAAGQPLFDRHTYKDKFAHETLSSFKIYPTLPQQAAQRLHRLSPSEYLSLWQHYTTPIAMQIPHQKTMHKAYLYSDQGLYYLAKKEDQTWQFNRQAQENSPSISCISYYEHDVSRNYQVIKLLFHAEATNKQALLTSSSASSPQQGQILCCPFPPVVASYERNDTLIQEVYSDILTFPYLRQTNVQKKLYQQQVIQIDSTITILQVDLNKGISIGDQKKYINGRLLHDFVNIPLRLDLDY